MEPECVSAEPDFDSLQHLYLPQDCGYAVRIMNPDECRKVGTFALNQLALYRLDNLDKAALTLDPGGDRSTCVSGDCARGGFLIATSGLAPTIHRFSPTATALDSFPIANQDQLEKAGTHIICMRAPPKGNTLLIITDVATLRVKLPK